ncbi:MAG: hypothetical protein PHH77_07300 [Victivallaceae bacterium]|nr:hypothetical protein [Victivallaceae bacterium]
MNFFTALFGTCKGTKVFSALRAQSVIRALGHLLLLTLICSLFILACTYSPATRKIDEIFVNLKDVFGDIRIDKNGITPTKTTEMKSLIIADNQLKITYLPAVNPNYLNELDANDISSGFLWTPTLIASWFKVSPDQFLLVPFAYCAKRLLGPESIKRSAIAAYINSRTSLNDRLICQFPELSWPALSAYCKNTFLTLSFIGNLAGIVLQVVFFVALFALILNLSGQNANYPVLKYRDRFVVGIYASFPPLLIAAMFSAFELPFLTFNSVYVICFSIYLIVVFSRLQSDLNRQRHPNPK